MYVIFTLLETLLEIIFCHIMSRQCFILRQANSIVHLQYVYVAISTAGRQ